MNDPNMFSVIMEEAMEDLQSLREYPSMDPSQEQFWLEYQIWNTMVHNARFPGDVALLEEIHKLRISRLQKAYEERTKADTPVNEATEDFRHLGAANWLPARAYDSDNDDEAADLESVQGEFKVPTRRKKDSRTRKAIIEEHFDRMAMSRKRKEFEVDPYCSQRTFERALKALEAMDAADNRQKNKFSVRFEVNQDIINALYCGKADRSGIEWVEKELGVKLRCRFERVEIEGEWVKQYVVRPRPTNPMEALTNPEQLRSKLNDAFHFLRYWSNMIGGDLRKNKYNQLTSLQKAFVLHKEQKRTEMEAYRQAQTKFSVKKEQNRPNLVADERIDALRPVFLRNTQVNTAHTTIMSNDPTPRSSPRDSSPASSQPILNTDYRDSLPCPSSTGKRKRISSPEPLERVVKCGKLNSSSELNPGFALPGASICESERRIPGVLLDYDAVENGEVSVRFEREESA